MCLDLFLEEAPCASILVRDHSVCPTVFDNLESGKKKAIGLELCLVKS